MFSVYLYVSIMTHVHLSILESRRWRSNNHFGENCCEDELDVFLYLNLRFASFSLVLLSSLPTGTAATSFGDETTHWSCCENRRGRRRRRRSSRGRRRQRWLRLQPKHQPATKLDVVKLSNYIRKLQENLRRRRKKQHRTFPCCVP